ncbi:MAG: ABC transporter permease [Elusimicrobia bacterium]|nr:ABC transporter permease [Elusimicrobiota bacterium]
MTLWLLAWRNVRRNLRRSALSVGSVAVGLAAVMFGQSLLRSFQRQMIDKATGVMLGHLEVQAAGAKNRQTPERLLEGPERFAELFAHDPRVAAVGPRLLYTGLAASAVASRGILIAGVDPAAERGLSIIPSYLVRGRYLKDGRDVVLGVKLAHDLDVRVGEKLVLMAQQPSGDMGSQLFRVAGIYETRSFIYDSQVAYVPLPAAQALRARPGAVSHVAVRLKDSSLTERVKRDYEGRLGDPKAVLLSYRDVGTEVVGIKKFQDAILAVVMLVIYAIVSLGILNTVSMSMYERIREFGVIRAVGARPGALLRLILAEAALLGALGAAGGLALGGALIALFGWVGLPLPLGAALSYFMPFDDVVIMHAQWGLHLRSAAGLWLACLLAALGPAVRAMRLVVSDALRHV